MSLKIIIVDKEDNEIGSKERNEISNDDIYRVSGLWIKNSEGKTLLARRSFRKKKHPGKWATAVAGTVEVGETYDSNIIKEAKEELGLENINIVKSHKKISSSGTHFTQWYTAIVDMAEDKFILQKEEVEEIKWFSKEEFFKELGINREQFLPSLERWFSVFG